MRSWPAFGRCRDSTRTSFNRKGALPLRSRHVRFRRARSSHRFFVKSPLGPYPSASTGLQIRPNVCEESDDNNLPEFSECVALNKSPNRAIPPLSCFDINFSITAELRFIRTLCALIISNKKKKKEAAPLTLLYATNSLRNLGA